MNFDLSEDQRTFEETLLGFFTKDFPLASVREVFDGGTGVSEVLWKTLAGMGIFGILVPEQYHGLGLELLDLAVASECLGYAAAPGPFLEHVLATLAITLGGDVDQRARWLPRLADGTARATIALAEDNGGWLPRSWRIEAGPTLSGTKRWVLNPVGADLVVVGCRNGLALVVPDHRVVVDPLDPLDRTRRVADLRFDGAPAELLPGGGEVLGRLLDAALVLLAADAAGAARRSEALAVDYAKSREQFGVTIGHFQALKHQLADMALEAEPMRGLYWYAAHAYDHVPEDSPRFAALAKAHITDRAAEIGRRAVEAHGGVGYTWGADVHFFLKRAVFNRMYLGSPSLHRARVAAMHGWSSPGGPSRGG